jgi:hypothetical protein
MSVNFAYEVSFVLQGFLTRRKISRRGADGFTSPPKEVMLRIFIALKDSLSFAGFEPASLESNGKHVTTGHRGRQFISYFLGYI